MCLICVCRYMPYSSFPFNLLHAKQFVLLVKFLLENNLKDNQKIMRLKIVFVHYENTARKCLSFGSI